MTRNQMRLKAFIAEFNEAKGYCPSFEEMKEHLGLKSKSGVHRIISALEERGEIVRLAHRARAIEVVYDKEAPASLVAALAEIRHIANSKGGARLSRISDIAGAALASI